MSSLDRELYEVFVPAPTLDLRALSMASDLYAEETGDVDDLALGAAILTYLDSVHQAGFKASQREMP